jgi:hypothetical protein
VIVPLKVAVQLALATGLVKLVVPETENGSPFGFIGLPSARETVTAKTGVAAAAESASASTSDTALRVLIIIASLGVAENRRDRDAGLDPA